MAKIRLSEGQKSVLKRAAWFTPAEGAFYEGDFRPAKRLVELGLAERLPYPQTEESLGRPLRMADVGGDWEKTAYIRLTEEGVRLAKEL